MTYLQSIAKRLQRSEDQLRLPSELIRQGYDPTFLATYRADEVGLLDRQALESLQRTLRHADAVEKQRVEIIDQLKADDTYSDDLQQLLAKTLTTAALDALTRGIRSKKGSRAISAKSPKVLQAVETLLTFDGETPSDVEAWLIEQFEVPEDERNAFSAQVRRMLQCLIAEDVQLLDRMMSQLRRHMVISSEMLPEPTSEQNVTEPNTGDAGAQTAQVDEEKVADDSASKAVEGTEKIPGQGTVDSTTAGAPVDTSSDTKVAVTANADTQGTTPEDSEDSSTEVQSDGAAGNAEDGVSGADAAEDDHVENATSDPVVDESPTKESSANDASSTSGEAGVGEGDRATKTDADLKVDGFKGKSDHAKLRKGKKEKPVAVSTSSSNKSLSPRQRRRRWLRGVLESLTKIKRNIGKLSAYQILMLGRGERSRIVELKYNYDRKQLIRMARESICPKEHPMREYLSLVASEHAENTILPRLESDLLAEAEELAQQALLDSAIGQLDSLLMQRPVDNKTILSIDAIGPKTAAYAVIGKKGEVIHADEIACNSSKSSVVSRNVIALGEIIHKHNVDVIVLSSGPARRYLIHTIKELMSQSADGSLHWTMADRSGVDAYCATRIALRELPEHSKRHRAAIWIGRRVQNPLAELLKIDPARLRLGSYQRELPQDDLKESLNRAFQAARAAQGVDFWNGSLEEFERLPGIDAENANRIIALRTSNDSASRELLREQLLPYLGETNFRQSIGFIRVFGSEQPLDATDIHPDDYKLAERLVSNTELELPSNQPEGWVKGNVGIIAEANNPADDSATETSSNAEGQSEESKPQEESGTASESTASESTASESTASESTASESSTADSSTSDVSEPKSDTNAGEDAPIAEQTPAAEQTPTAEQTPSAELDATTPIANETETVGETQGEPSTGVDAPESTDAASDAEGAASPEKKSESLESKPSADQTPGTSVRELKSLQIPAIKMNEVAVDVEKMARGWQVGREKLKNICRSLQNPFADLRHTNPTIPLLSQVPSFENLRPGMSVWAVVIGVADFGVFADLGPDCNGLIHVSRLSPNYVEDPNQLIQAGDLIQVWVLNVDHEKRRIALSAIPPGTEPRENDRSGRSERGRSNRGRNDRGRNDRNRSDGSRHPAGGNRGGHSGDRDGRNSGQSGNDSRGRGSNDRGRSDRGKGKSGKGGFSDSKRDGGRRDGGRRDSRGNRQRRGNDRSRGPITYEAKSKLDPGSEPISDAVKQGKEPMGSFGDLLQVYQSKRDQVSDDAAEKRKQGNAPKSNDDSNQDASGNDAQSTDVQNGDSKTPKTDDES